MLTKLKLERFKNFKDATLALGPMTVLIGVNASGKSNIRDAFRFLHGISRGYNLAEIIGEKYGEGGVLLWGGIRGGTREIAYLGEDNFEITVDADVKAASLQYHILINLLKEKKIVFENSDTAIISELNSTRFLDLNPQAIRNPSFPGQVVLGDRGENLSSVLQAICEDSQQKKTLIEWIRELTPMDVVDFEFIPDQIGRILVTFVEKNGKKISAYSASDGTLRFLAMLAALLSPEPARLYFFEELENGLHPSRLHLLLQLMENKAFEGKVQIVATTHSPQLLRFLSPKALEYAHLIYRLPDSPEGRIKRILDIPDAQRLIKEQDIADLHDSGWFEDVMYFSEDEHAEAAA
ncbi:MAG TPA: ATPase [Desulfobacteraceae bacterium]|nr:ATPase [Desulfobacteraceae bacterium]